jgi:hypothetical protein
MSQKRERDRDTRRNADLLIGHIEKILAEAKDEGAVRQIELIHGLLTSPAAAWLVGKTEREVLAEAESRGWRQPANTSSPR